MEAIPNAALAAATLVVGVGVYYICRLRSQPPPSLPDAAQDVAAAEAPEATCEKAPTAKASPSSKQRKTRQGKKKEDEALKADEAARALLPPIAVGTKCWHAKLLEEVTIAKVYYDDPPPYYVVRCDDGSERNTVRGRLYTMEERAIELAAEKAREAEARANAAAEALLAEELQASKGKRRKPSSGRK